MSESNSLNTPSPPSASRIRAIARELSSTLKDADKKRPPPVLDLQGVDYRGLVKYVVYSAEFSRQKGHIGQILSFALIPSEWPSPGLPALRKAAGDAAKSAVCGKVWKEDTLAYKCKTCERDPTCVICVECFREGDHTGHDFSVLRTSGGCCDCGDPQAWRPGGFCRHHPGTSSEHVDPSASIDPVLRRNIMGALQAVAERLLYFCLSGYQDAHRLHYDVPLARELLEWLLQIAECGDGFRRLISKCLTDPSEWPPTALVVRQERVDMSKVSWLRVILSLEGVSRMSVIIQDTLHRLYFQLITSLSFKRAFLELLMLNYESFLHAKILRKARTPRQNEYGLGEHNGADVAEVFAVQLFTVPALVPVMIQEGGLLDILLDIIVNLFETFATPVRPYDTSIPYEYSKFAHRSNHPIRERYTRPVNPKASASNASYSSLKRRRCALPLTFAPEVRNAARRSKRSSRDGEGNRGQHIRTIPRLPQLQTCRLQQNPVNHARVWDADGYGPSEVESLGEGREMPNRDANQNLDRSNSHLENNTAVGFRPRADARLQTGTAAMDRGADASDDGNFDSMADEGGRQDQPDQVEAGVHVTDPGPDEGTEDADMAIEEPEFHVRREFRWDGIGHADTEEQLDIFETGMHVASHRPGAIPSSDFRSRENHSYGNHTHRNEMESRLEGISSGSHSRETVGKVLLMVHEARVWGESAISGHGPLAHTLRLDWAVGERRLCETMSWRVMNDLRYVLTHTAAAFHLVHVRKDLFRKFVRLLSMAQGMNPSTRKFGDHVSMEPESSHKSLTIELELFNCVNLLSDAFCGVNLPSETAEEAASMDLAKSRLECMRIVRACLDEWLEREEALEARSVYRDEIFSVAHSVSIHLPLHRLLAFMMHHIIRQDGVSVREAICGVSGGVSEDDVRRLMRHPLRISAFLGQVRAGMWKRNGSNLANQVQFYFNSLTSDWFLDLDLFIQQCCAVVLGPRIFTEEAKVAFCIRDLEECLLAFSSERTEEHASKVALTAPNVGLHPLAPKKYGRTGLFSFPVMPDCGNTFTSLKEFVPILVQDFFVLIVRVASERGKCGLGETQELRRKLLHRLCSRDSTHSQLSQMLSSTIARGLQTSNEEGDSGERWNALVRSIIGEIGDYVEPKGMEQGRYRLKTELWREFDPFEPHLSTEDRNAAFVRHESTRRILRAARQVIPADNVNERPIFPQLRELCDLSTFQAGPAGVATKLLRAYCANTDSAQVIENSLPAALHLACMAVEKCHAAEREQPFWFDYDPFADEESTTAFGNIISLYERYKSADCTHLSDVAPTLSRIIHQAIVRINPNLYPSLTEFLRKRGEEWGITRTHEPRCSPVGAAELSEKMRKDAKRKEYLKKRKLQQQTALAQMRQQQSKFAEFIDSGEDDSTAIPGSSGPSTSGTGRDTQSVDDLKVAKVSPVPNDDVQNQSTRVESLPPTHTASCETYECVLCHGSGGEDDDSLLGLIGFHQKSRIPLIAKEQCQIPREATERAGEAHVAREQVGMALTEEAGVIPQTSTSARFRFRERAHHPAGQQPNVEHIHEEPENNANLRKSVILNTDLLRNGVENPQTLHLSFCGHAAHIRCFDRYFASLISTREHERIHEGHNVLDLDKMEFLCPVCRRVANVVFPLVAGHGTQDCPDGAASDTDQGSEMPYDEWLQRCDRDAQERPMGSNAEDMHSSRYSEHELSGSGNNRNEGASSSSVQNPIPLANLHIGWASAISIANRGETILRRFNLQSLARMTSAGTSSLSSGRNVGSRLGPYSSLPSVAITTAACAEIACRAFPWNGNESKAYRKSVGLVLRKIRAHTRMEPYPVQYTLRILWMEIRSPDTAKYLDPFATFAFLFLLWPETRLSKEVHHLVRLGLLLICSHGRYTSLRNPMELTYEALLYLRQCSILISTLFDKLAAPPIRSYQRSEATHESAGKEIADLLKYLEIPNVSQLELSLSKRVPQDLPVSPPLRFRPKRTSLIKLPEIFQTLLESLSGRKCETCSLSPSPYASILCLVCGAVLCRHQPRCVLSSPGAHATECGNGTGVFLVVMLTSVHIIRDERSSTWGSPYLDAHGEEDEGLHRGKPLYLNEARYSALEKLWLTNSFDQDPRLLRRTIPNVFLPMQFH